MKKRPDWFVVIYSISLIVGVVLFGIELFLLFRFANTPIEDIPAWLLWLLFWR